MIIVTNAVLQNIFTVLAWILLFLAFSQSAQSVYDYKKEEYSPSTNRNGTILWGALVLWAAYWVLS